mgnify:CR=1 FL=1
MGVFMRELLRFRFEAECKLVARAVVTRSVGERAGTVPDGGLERRPNEVPLVKGPPRPRFESGSGSKTERGKLSGQTFAIHNHAIPRLGHQARASRPFRSRSAPARSAATRPSQHRPQPGLELPARTVLGQEVYPRHNQHTGRRRRDCIEPPGTRAGGKRDDAGPIARPFAHRDRTAERGHARAPVSRPAALHGAVGHQAAKRRPN